ncbi:MAG TPA: LysM peptidoglycan-binding domain-containing protein [Solirubrobacteraceae bacterium]|nr:LysM peptidoglycan-binding domain-containing protein [Solirubrobacteraceae bacterium]
MSEAADIPAEIPKPARLLSLEPEDLELDAHGDALGRLAAASKLLPVGVVALLAERAFGPVLAARMAGMLEPSRVIDVASKLPAMFLADAATHIDPRCASVVIPGLPPAHLAEVTRELVRRGEFETIGRFVRHLDTEATAAALDAMDATTAVQSEGAAEQPRGRVARFLVPAAVVTLVAVIGVVVTTSPDGAATHSRPARSSHPIARRSPPYWTVRSGDTFTEISEETGLTIGQLEAFNPNTDPGALVPGQRLNLSLHPVALPSKTPGPTFWTVGPGESFGSIAAKTGINLATLERLNPRLTPVTLQPGDRVRLSR